MANIIFYSISLFSALAAAILLAVEKKDESLKAKGLSKKIFVVSLVSLAAAIGMSVLGQHDHSTEQVSTPGKDSRILIETKKVVEESRRPKIPDEKAVQKELVGQELSKEQKGLVLQYYSKGTAAYNVNSTSKDIVDNFNKALEIAKTPSLYLAVGNGLLVNGSYDEAFANYESAVTLFDKQGNKGGKAQALSNMGIIYANKGELDKALENYENSLFLYTEAANKLGQANQKANIALIKKSQGLLDEALKFYQESFTLYDEVNDKFGKSQQLGNIGSVYHIKGNLDKALEYYEKAIPIHIEMGDQIGQARMRGNIGVIYSDKGYMKKAVKYLQEAFSIYESIGHQLGQAKVLGTVGFIHYTKGKLDEAISYFEKALELNKAINRPLGAALQLENIGLAFLHKGGFDQSLSYLNKAKAIYEEIGSTAHIKRVEERISTVIATKEEFAADANNSKEAVEETNIEQQQNPPGASNSNKQQ